MVRMKLSRSRSKPRKASRVMGRDLRLFRFNLLDGHVPRAKKHIKNKQVRDSQLVNIFFGEKEGERNAFLSSIRASGAGLLCAGVYITALGIAEKVTGSQYEIAKKALDLFVNAGIAVSNFIIFNPITLSIPFLAYLAVKSNGYFRRIRKAKNIALENRVQLTLERASAIRQHRLASTTGNTTATELERRRRNKETIERLYHDEDHLITNAKENGFLKFLSEKMLWATGLFAVANQFIFAANKLAYDKVATTVSLAVLVFGLAFSDVINIVARNKQEEEFFERKRTPQERLASETAYLEATTFEAEHIIAHLEQAHRFEVAGFTEDRLKRIKNGELSLGHIAGDEMDEYIDDFRDKVAEVERLRELAESNREKALILFKKALDAGQVKENFLRVNYKIAEYSLDPEEKARHYLDAAEGYKATNETDMKKYMECKRKGIRAVKEALEADSHNPDLINLRTNLELV